MTTRFVTDVATAAAARAFPRARRHDARVVRDLARESIDTAGMRALPRETLSIAAAGLRTRARTTTDELREAPWRAGLRALTLPVASALLAVWLFGFVVRYDHWPLGEGWTLLLSGSLLAVVGAACGARWPLALGAAATFAAAISPHAGLGTESALADTPSFFQGDSIDIAAASLAPTALLTGAALALPVSPRQPLAMTLRRLALGLVPAALALLVALPAPQPTPTRGLAFKGPGREPEVIVGPPYAFPWMPESRPLLAALALALLAVVVVASARSRRHPAGALAAGLVLVTVAFPLVWAGLNNLDFAPYWAYQSVGVTLLLAAAPLLVAFALMRRAGRRA